MFVFGGRDEKKFYGDLHILDLEVMAWSSPRTSGPSPSPRAGHTSLLIGNNLIIQGGFYYDEEKIGSDLRAMGRGLRSCYLNDLRVLDTALLAWSRLRVSGTPPAPRFGHSINLSGADIIMFGGWHVNSGNRALKDLQPEGNND